MIIIMRVACIPLPHLFETLKMEALADGIMDAAVLLTYEKRVRSEDKQSEVLDGWSMDENQ